jgi:hypothetical protein
MCVLIIASLIMFSQILNNVGDYKPILNEATEYNRVKHECMDVYMELCGEYPKCRKFVEPKFTPKIQWFIELNWIQRGSLKYNLYNAVKKNQYYRLLSPQLKTKLMDYVLEGRKIVMQYFFNDY